MKQITKFLTRIAIVSAIFLCNSHLMAQGNIILSDGNSYSFTITGSNADNFSSLTATNSATPIIQIGDASPVDITLTGNFLAYYGNFTFTNGSTLYFAPSNSNMPAKMVIGGTGFTAATTFVKQTGALSITGSDGNNNTIEIQPYGVLDLTDAANSADLELSQSLYISSYNDANAGLIKFKPGATTNKLICDNGTIKTDDPTNGQIDVSKHFQFDMSAATGTDGVYSDFIVATTLAQPYITNASSPNVINPGLWQNISVQVTGSGPYNIILHAQYGPFVSSTTDYFRSVATGDWSNPSTWESSPDNSIWGAASLAPTNAATLITIQNADVTIDVDGQTTSSIIIETGSTLTNSGTNTLNVSGDWTNNGGTFTASTGTVNYNGAGQAIGVYTYNNLNLSGSGTKTFTGATVSKSLSVSSGVVADLGTGLSHTAFKLYLDGTDEPLGTWGATGSGATNINDTYFAGTGIIDVPCIVYIPDANFKLALISMGLDANSNLEIDCSEASAYTGTIDVSNQGITDLTGIEAFTNITYLNCYGNSLTSLDVSANTALTQLRCQYNNQLTNLNTTGVTTLNELRCAHNQLASLDISTNTALTLLGCANNQLSSLDVSANTALTMLHCPYNQLTSLDVSANTALTSLYCYNNSLTSLNVKNGNNTSLLDFNAAGNPSLSCIQVDNAVWSTANWTNIDAGASFSTDCACIVTIPDPNFKAALLTISGIDANSDGEIQCFEASAYTGAIEVSSQSISDLTGIEAFTKITSLNCSSNSLTSLDVSSNIALNILYCSNNQLSSLNVKNGNNSNFTDFNATSNSALTCIQVDDAVWSYANWPNKDAGAVYNTNCSNCIVNIPDANFKAALLLIAGLDANSDGEIQCSEATAWIGTIDVSSKSIFDLTGIETFTNITNLTCNNNTLTSLNVSSNLALEYLDCSNNSLTSLNVSNNTALTSLTCNNNSLLTLDVSINTALTALYCNNNHLTSLNVKNAYNTIITNFDARVNPGLSCIQVDDAAWATTNWTNIDGLESFSEVCTVNIPDPNFKAALIGNGIDINIDGEIQYDEASVYAGSIGVNSWGIADLTGIEAFTNITSLDCSSNSLEGLDVSSNKALQTLNCNYNSLTSLNVSSNTALNILYCSNNQLSSLNTSGVTALTELHCAYNQLASLDISTNTALTTLGCSNNLLTSLVVSDNTDLSQLHCQYNQITSLDVSDNTALTSLYCYNNSLTSLNVKNGNNASIYDFDATSNPSLSCILVDDVAYMNSNSYIDGMEGFSEDCSCVVNIPDDNFRSYLLSTINLNSDGIIDCGEASAYIGSIDVNSMGISDLTGIEAFTALTELNCNYNSLTSLNVSANTALEYLDCSYNTLTGLNVQNGNNTNFSGFDATNNSGLTCIQVDDAAWSTDYWPNKDAGASYSTTDCGADLTWTGNTDTDWNTVSNWNNGFVPSVSNNITIPYVTNDPIATDITVGVGKVLTINPAGNLTINGTLNNNGTVAIKSDATGTGSLIVASVSGSGTASAERYMTGSAWHVVSPIAAFGSISTFIQAPGNAIPSKDVSGTNRYGMMDYNETTNTWNPYYAATTLDILPAGKGYSVRRTSDGIVTFTGDLTSGTKLVLLSMSVMGWNCIGNPYTSAINMNDAANASYNFLKTNAIDNTSTLDPSYACMYFWDDATLSYKILGNVSFDTRDLLQNVLQSGQGFFVKAASDGVIVQFTQAMQVHSTATNLKSAEVAWPSITLGVSNNKTSASAVVAFNNSMTKGLDPTYDAGLLRGTSGLELYSRLVNDNGVDFAIQCLPETYNSLVIPLGVESKTGGEITFSAETVDLPAACKVILEDKATNTFTSLADGASYKTTVSAGSTAVGRFYIHTGDNSTTGTSGQAAIGNLKAYTVKGAIIIEGEVSDGAIATLYNLQGLKVRVQSLQKGLLNTLSCPDLMNGIYILTIEQDGKTVTKKLIKLQI